jgi:hypothetical protein
MTEAQARAAEQVHEIAEAGGFGRLLTETKRRKAQVERAVVRRLLRQVAGKYQL